MFERSSLLNWRTYLAAGFISAAVLLATQRGKVLDDPEKHQADLAENETGLSVSFEDWPRKKPEEIKTARIQIETQFESTERDFRSKLGSMLEASGITVVESGHADLLVRARIKEITVGRKTGRIRIGKGQGPFGPVRSSSTSTSGTYELAIDSPFSTTSFGDRQTSQGGIRTFATLLELNFGTDVPAIVSLLGQGGPSPGQVLAKIQDPAVLDSLQAVLQDPEDRQFGSALEMCKDSRDRRALPVLHEVLASGRHKGWSEGSQEFLIRRVGEFRDPSSIDLLSQQIDDASPYLRKAIAVALCRIGHPKIANPLIELLRSPDRQVVGQVCRQIRGVLVNLDTRVAVADAMEEAGLEESTLKELRMSIRQQLAHLEKKANEQKTRRNDDDGNQQNATLLPFHPVRRSSGTGAPAPIRQGPPLSLQTWLAQHPPAVDREAVAELRRQIAEEASGDDPESTRFRFRLLLRIVELGDPGPASEIAELLKSERVGQADFGAYDAYRIHRWAGIAEQCVEDTVRELEYKGLEQLLEINQPTGKETVNHRWAVGLAPQLDRDANTIRMIRTAVRHGRLKGFAGLYLPEEILDAIGDEVLAEFFRNGRRPE